MKASLLRCLGLFAGLCSLSLLHLLLPLLLLRLHLRPELSFPLLHQRICLCLGLLLGLFCLSGLALQLLRQLSRGLELLLCWPCDLSLLQLLAGSGIAHLARVDELCDLALARLYEDKDALSKGHAIAVGEGNCHAGLQRRAVDKAGACSLGICRLQSHRSSLVLDDGVLLVDARDLQSNFWLVRIAILLASAANASDALLEGKLQLRREEQVLVEVGDVRKFRVGRFLFLGTSLLCFRQPFREALLHLHQCLL
mmetsp:Transcript_63383/g.148344  ORF Transcript_63383/g.148344 Transcript_63383/m.148344 type:complete len:254 (-) Transcript_63383:1348-2109(-)